MRGKQMSGFPKREQALETFFKAWEPKCETEMVPMHQAVGRITAKEMYAQNMIPVFRTSSCDGIAVSSGLFANGFPDTSTWRCKKEYDRADTGDDFADSYDAVIPAEEVDIGDDGTVKISPDVPVKAGWNVRPAGDSVKKNELLIRKGQKIRPMDLAALAAGGVLMVPVRKKPAVAFIPTGSELISAGTRPKRGENVDTNSLLVSQRLVELGAEPLVFPIIRDDPAEIEHALNEALEAADIVIINGGTAKGGEDFNFRILEERGKIIHHYIAAAPGRPLAMAVVDGKPVINLPGPTVAALFGMEWCLPAVIAGWLGIPIPKRMTLSCVLEEEVTTTPHMAIMCLMRITKSDKGYHAHPLSFFSESLPTVLRANGLFVSDVGCRVHNKGDMLTVDLLQAPEYIEEEVSRDETPRV